MYYEVLESALDTLTDRDIYILLIESGKWDSSKEDKIKSLRREIENNKIAYFNNFYSPEIKRTNKKLIDQNENDLMELLGVRHQYNNMTAEGIAAGAMWQEMITYMYKGEDKLTALATYHSNFIGENTIRSIVLSDEWAAYSNLSKNPFGRAIIKLTDFQRKLCSWSNVYRNVRNHPDRPDEKIIEDHDAFDGWMINQSRKDRAEKKIKITSKGIKPNASDVFVFGNTEQDIDDILSLNGPEARAKMESVMKKTGKL